MAIERGNTLEAVGGTGHSSHQKGWDSAKDGEEVVPSGADVVAIYPSSFASQILAAGGGGGIRPGDPKERVRDGGGADSRLVPR